MPRVVKESGKAKEPTAKRPYHRKTVPVAPVANETAIQAVEAPAVETTPLAPTPARKSYPSIAERIALADKQIARLTALSASRTALVEKTNALLLERQEALAKSTAALTAAEAKKAKLVAAASKPPKVPREKLSPEERKARMTAGRAAKKAENEKYKALIDALKTSGKSVEELLSELKG